MIRDYPAIGKWNILSGYIGSISHGTYVPSKDPLSIDDKDVMGFCVPPPQYYLGLRTFGSRGTQVIKKDEWDIVIYEAKKGISLLRQGNPNVLAILWLAPNHYISVTATGQLLLDNRQLFVGRHVYRPFIGYATSQLRKMTHYKFDGYMGRKRKSIVENFGFDILNAAHLIRLLRMGIEFLNDGELYVFRHDAQEILSIKRGEWGLEKVKAEAERLFIVAEEAYLQSSLPVGPDKEAISHLCEDIIRATWTRNENA